MNHKFVVQTIVKIERQFDVNSLHFEDLKIWPLIRFDLYRRLLNPHNPHLQRELNIQRRVDRLIRAPFKIVKFMTNKRQYQRQLQNLYAVGSVDILFYSRVQEYRDKIEGRYYNIVIDPMIDLVKDKYNFLKIELSAPNLQRTLPRFGKTHFLDPWYFLIQKRFQRFFKRDYGSHGIDGFNDLKKTVLKIIGEIHLKERFIIEQVYRLIWYRAFFGNILSEMRPKVVFMACYPGLITMALISAGKKLGIRTVDVQHGLQGRYSTAYSHWTRIPQDGYELLPDVFWTWGRESQKNIEKWLPYGCRHHRPVIGGNRWLAKWIDADGSPIDTNVDTFINKLHNINKIILVTLQPKEDILDILPQHVLDAMRRSSNDWLWLIRPHPKQNSLVGEMNIFFKRQGINNFEIEQAANNPLNALLKHADHHITEWSSSCYEALAFNVFTTLVHPNGFDLYEEFVKKGIFTYAETSEALLEAINTGCTQETAVEKNEYIETSRKIADEAINKILNESIR